MRNRGDDILASIAIDVEHVHEPEFPRARLTPIGRMERPFASRPRVGGRFQPSLRRQDIVAPVAVEIARANAVAVTLHTHHMPHPLVVLQLVPEDRRAGGARELRKNLERLAVVVQVYEKRELGRTDRFNLRLGPGLFRFSRILQPDDPSREVRRSARCRCSRRRRRPRASR